MKKSSDVGIGVGVAGLSGGQAVLLVMEYQITVKISVNACNLRHKSLKFRTVVFVVAARKL